MSRLVGKELTKQLSDRLSGRNVRLYEGKIIPIFTLDGLGWPHPALLSYYEVVAKNPSTLDIALWKDSSTAGNLRRTGKLTLMITDKGINYYVKGTVRELETEMAGAPAISRFRMITEQLLEDQEPNTEITSGLTYSRLAHPESTDFAAKVLRLLAGDP